jgi:hypothetical protein
MVLSGFTARLLTLSVRWGCPRVAVRLNLGPAAILAELAEMRVAAKNRWLEYWSLVEPSSFKGGKLRDFRGDESGKKIK